MSIVTHTNSERKAQLNVVRFAGRMGDLQEKTMGEGGHCAVKTAWLLRICRRRTIW